MEKKVITDAAVVEAIREAMPVATVASKGLSPFYCEAVATGSGVTLIAKILKNGTNSLGYFCSLFSLGVSTGNPLIIAYNGRYYKTTGNFGCSASILFGSNNSFSAKFYWHETSDCYELYVKCMSAARSILPLLTRGDVEYVMQSVDSLPEDATEATLEE